MDYQRKFIAIKPSDVLDQLCNLRQLVFEVTDACNLRCTYCAYSNLYIGRDARTGKYLSIEQAKVVIDYLTSLWRVHSLLGFPKRFCIGFYGGEPLLHFKLIKEIIEYIECQKGIDKTLLYTITTNGLLLDKYIDYLAEKKFSLLISFDGDEQAQGFRVDLSGRNSFTQVYKNIKLIQQMSW